MRMKVKPLPGKILRDPRSKLPLPPEGKEVTIDSFWQRRLDAGDVLVVEEDVIPALDEDLLDDSQPKKKKKK